MRTTRTLLALVAVSVSLVSGVVVAAQLSRADPTPFAYTTETELVIVRGDTTVARVPRIFDAAENSSNRLVWTHDGSHIGLLSDTVIRQGDPSDVTLISVDTHSGDIRRFPCPGCYDVAALGDTSVVALAYRDDRFLDFDLAGGTAGHADIVRTQFGAGSAQVLASTRDFVALASYDNGERVQIVRRGGGKPTVLGRFVSNSYIVAATRTDRAAGTGTFALGTRPAPGLCRAQFPVWLLDTTGTLLPVDTTAFAPPGHLLGADAGIEINDLAWDPDGILTASVTSWTCDPAAKPGAEKVPFRPATEWRLEPSGWVAEPTIRADVVRRLDPATQAVLSMPNCTGPIDSPTPGVYCNSGTLRIENGDRSSLVADGVISLSTPTPDLVPGGSRPGAPVRTAPDIESLTRIAGCAPRCQVSGTVSVEHPTWGHLTIATVTSPQRTAPASILAVDDAGTLRWRRDFAPDTFDLLVPLGVDRGPDDTGTTTPRTPVDALGHVFLNYNPGRYNGVIVLGPTADGFDDYGSLPPPDSYFGAFYNAEVTDGTDGTFAIARSSNDCDPSCAGGMTTTSTYRWDGTQYATS